MSRGKQPGTELEHLAAGPGQAADPYMLSDRMALDVAELAAGARGEMRYTALTMIRAGRYYMAIKKKLGHGEWEAFVVEQHWSWNYVRASMKLLEVAARFPQLLHLPAGKTTHSLLRLPMPQISAVMEELPPKAVDKLTPWDLENIYRDKIAKDQKPKPKKDFPDVAPSELDSLAAKAQSALLQIYDLKLAPDEYERALRYRNDLQLAWDRASYTLRDPEHKTTPIFSLHPMADDITEDD